MAAPSRRQQAGIISVALVLALAVGARSIRAEPADAYPTIPGATVSYRTVDRVVWGEALVEPVRQSTIASQVSGRIVEFTLKAGDRVGVGQLIARIDGRAAEQALAASEAQVAEARAQLANAQASYERTRRLVAQKFMSQAALDQAEAQFKAAQAQVAALQAGARQAATQSSFTSITAPYSGIVATTHVELGDMAQPGRELVTIFEPGKLRVTATLPQAAATKVRREAPVRIDLPALGRTLTATGATWLPIAESRTHTTRVRLDLPASEGVLPGQFARAGFVTGRASKLVIPEQSVVRRSEVTAVYVIGDGPPRLRQIRLGEVVGDRMVEVLAGLSEGERVALDPVRAGSAASSPSDRQPADGRAASKRETTAK